MQNQPKGHLAPLIDTLEGRRILVIGDMVADVYIDGRISRISREAPVLVLEQAGEKIIAGGAANVVHNCATLGGKVTAVGLVGDDRQADGICTVLENAGVDTSGLLRDAARPTISKTRIIAGGRATVSQQIVRLDRESHTPMSRATEAAMLRCLDKVLPETDGIVLSDYGAGTITEAVKGKLIGYAREHEIPSMVDSRYDIHRFSGIGYVKQNDAELAPMASSSRAASSAWSSSKKTAAFTTSPSRTRAKFTTSPVLATPASVPSSSPSPPASRQAMPQGSATTRLVSP